MNVNKNLKLLLMKLNQQGHEVSLIKEQRYSQQFNSIYSRYKLTFWIMGNKGKKVPDTHEFTSAIELLKYMVVKSNEREAKGIC